MRYRTSLLFLVAVIGFGIALPLYGQEKDALYPMQKKTKWGFINAQGEWEITPQYPQVLPFREGLAAARVAGKNKWGFLNKQGEWAISPTYGRKYSAYQRYGGKRFYDPPFDPFNGKYAPALVDSVLAYINKEGKTVKRFPTYSVLRPFYDGLAVFSKDDEKGYINKNWDVVIKPEYEEAGDFHGGLAYFKKSFGAPYGFINKKGTPVIEPQFEEAGPFTNGLAPAKAGAFKPYGYINRNGEWAIEPKFEKAHPFSEGLAFVTTKDGNKKQYINNKGVPQIVSPIEGLKLCHGHPFNNGLAMISIVKTGEECGFTTQFGSFRKAANSVYAYINKSGEIIHRQSFKNGRYLKRVNDSLELAEQKEEKREEQAEARRERKQLAKCADFKAFGDSTAGSYLEIGYKGVNRRFYYDNDVFQKEGPEAFKYHIPAFQHEPGNTFLELQPIRLEPSFLNESKMEANRLGYRFSLGMSMSRTNKCINFPTDATEDGSITNVKKKGQSSLWKRGQIKYTDPDNSKNYVLIHVRPDNYKTPEDEPKQGPTSVGGFILNDDDEKISLTEDDEVNFKHYPRQKKLEVSIRASQQLEGKGAGVRTYNSVVEIPNFEASPGKYFSEPVHRFDDHYVEYYRVLAYSKTDVHVKHYRQPLSEDETVNNDNLPFSQKYLVGEYKGGKVLTAVDPKPVVYQLSN